MGEKLKEEIGLTNQRIDEVNTGLEGYHACVDAKNATEGGGIGIS